MEIKDPGHHFILDELDQDDPTKTYYAELIFVKREGKGYPGNIGHYRGTTLQECWRAEIKRLLYLDNQEQHLFNSRCINRLRQNIIDLETRAAQRHKRQIPEFWPNVEDMPTCKKCLHIGCKGGCHH